MDKSSRAYLIILYLIWPFSAFITGIRYFDYSIGRKLLIALYAFLGFTAISFGDLDRYESQFYLLSNQSLSNVFESLVNLQTGKFYNGFISVVSGIFFDSHHYYFLILYLIYGYFLIKSIHLLKDISLKQLNWFGLMFFFGVLMYFMIRTIFNLAFYTGAVFILFNLISYYKYRSKKYLILLIFAPLFHIGLSIYLLIPLFIILFRNKLKYYIVFVVFSFVLGQSNFVGVIENLASSNSGTVIESKYKAYASEKGQMGLEKRYAKNAVNQNIKLKSQLLLQDSIWYFFVPLGVIILFFKRKEILIKYDLMMLYNIVLLCWGISNLMLNISQGVRFLNIFCFLAIGLFFKVYVFAKWDLKRTFFDKFIKVFVPLLFILGIVGIVSSHFMIPIDFYSSNYFVQIYRYSF